MDFFAQQDLARRNTRLLVVLFIAAVFLLMLVTNVIVAGLLFFSQNYSLYRGTSATQTFLSHFSNGRFNYIGLAVVATVTMIVLLKWLQLSTGG